MVRCRVGWRAWCHGARALIHVYWVRVWLVLASGECCWRCECARVPECPRGGVSCTSRWPRARPPRASRPAPRLGPRLLPHGPRLPRHVSPAAPRGHAPKRNSPLRKGTAPSEKVWYSGTAPKLRSRSQDKGHPARQGGRARAQPRGQSLEPARRFSLAWLIQAVEPVPYTGLADPSRGACTLYRPG